MADYKILKLKTNRFDARYEPLRGADDNYVTDAEKAVIANTSGTNTGDQDLTSYATKTNVLELDNTSAFTPDADYEPATKKYVDDNAGGGGAPLTVTLGTTGSGADFECDGTADDVELLAAIASLPATGGRVFVFPGTYYLSVRTVWTKNNFTLEGASQDGVIFKQPNGQNVFHWRMNVSGNSVILKNFTVNANKGNNTQPSTCMTMAAAYGLIQNVSFGYGYTGGLTTSANHITIENCRFYNNDGGAALTLFNYNRVVNSIFETNGYSGKAVITSTGHAPIIMGNHITGISTGGTCILINHTYAVVSGNRITGAGTTYSGIELTSTYASITGNTLDGDGAYGINETGSANYNLIDGNVTSMGTTAKINSIGANSVVGDNIA